MIALLIFGAVVFLGGPPLIRYFAQHQLSQLLRRPVSVGRITLNPYTLRLEVDQLQIGENLAGNLPPTLASRPFISLGRLVVRPSWSSLLRLKPVISELYLEALAIHLVRTGPQRFNFSDLVETFETPAAPASKPLRFAVANIRLENGRIDVDDQVLGTHHIVDQWRVGIPFIANLPAQAEIFVEPLLQARIDGSLLRITGQTKPFSNTLASTVALQIEQFDLTRLLPYVLYFAPHGLPVQLQQGWLSTQLSLSFARIDSQPQVKLSGTLDLRDLALADAAAAPLLKLQGLHVEAADIEPLRQVVHLTNLRVVAPQLAVTRDARGRFNLQQLLDPTPTIGTAAPAVAASASAPAGPPLDLAIQHFALQDGALSFNDRSVARPTQLALSQVTLNLDNFATLTRGNARFTAQLGLPQGGSLGSSGSLNLPARQLQAQVTLKQLALPPLQPWLDKMLAARIAQGQLSAQAALTADWSGAPAGLVVGPAQLDLDGLQVLGPPGSHAMLALGHGNLQLQHLDLATHQAQLAAISLDRLLVEAQRNPAGQLDLAELLKPDAAVVTHQERPSARARAPALRESAAAWHYQIGSVEVTHSSLGLLDHSQAQAASLSLAPLQIKVTQISDAFDRPWPFEIATSLNKKGSLAMHGKLTLAPFDATLHLETQRLDLAAFAPYFDAHLNAVIASALFNADGDVSVGQNGAGWHAAYLGDAGLENVRMLDKQSADLFAGWHMLAVSQIKARYTPDGTDVEARRVALSNFYARIFLDQNGRINLRNFVAQAAEPAASLTRTDASAPVLAAASAPVPVSSSAAEPVAQHSAPVNLHFGEFLLQQGKINYTDDFIKPNFTANLVDINGKIGAFGSHTTQPASVDIKASLDARGPVAINGTINPLVTPPALDMSASAHDIELTNFSPYSSKYAGYPITEGRLNVDLHYLLDKEQLSADNHVFIDQLTFGEHVDNTTATHLPVTLAIALLKNSRGQIDVDIPVSGSLSDPQFSLGGLIWHALANLLEKAVTAPFSLLANAFGSHAEQLQYVAFSPGSADLSVEEQKKLATLSQALNDKPAVKLEMAGRADPAVDGPALRQLAVEQAVRQAKIKELVGRGQSIDLSEVKVDADEYDKYLKQAYQAADFKKPHNFIGLNQSLPAADMKQLLTEHAPMTDATLRALAQQRVAVVHQWLDTQVAAQRLYDRSPKIDAQGITDQGATTRVDFVLK